jgi:hypothetical protein
MPNAAQLAAYAANGYTFHYRDSYAQYQRVDGQYTGSTDMIMRWAACKYGIDEDVVRAQGCRKRMAARQRRRQRYFAVGLHPGQLHRLVEHYDQRARRLHGVVPELLLSVVVVMANESLLRVDGLAGDDAIDQLCRRPSLRR